MYHRTTYWILLCSARFLTKRSQSSSIRVSFRDLYIRFVRRLVYLQNYVYSFLLYMFCSDSGLQIYHNINGEAKVRILAPCSGDLMTCQILGSENYNTGKNCLETENHCLVSKALPLPGMRNSAIRKCCELKEGVVTRIEKRLLRLEIGKESYDTSL